MKELIQVGKQVPINMLKELNKGSGERAFIVYTKSSMTAFIVLDNITKNEIKNHKGNLTVIYQDYQIPFLVLNYKNSSYDMPLSYSGDFLPNKLDIFLIDLNGYVTKHMRSLGLDENITNSIAKGIERVKDMSLEMIFTKAQVSIYPQYSTEEMSKGGVRQVFLRTK